MAKTFINLLAISVLIFIVGCSDEPPSVRVYNQHPSKANVQFKTPANTININDVGSGVLTNFQDISEGKTDVTAVIQDEADTPEVSFVASNNNNYTIVIVDGNPVTLRVDVSDK